MGANRLTPCPLLDYDEAAQYLHVSRRTLESMWARREVSASKVGRRVLFAREDLDAFVARHRIEAVR